ncbi:unnamed protein product, partial [marine sediment metagenome]
MKDIEQKYNKNSSILFCFSKIFLFISQFLKLKQKWPIYFLLVDKNKKIIFWNKKARKITGYNESDVINKSCSDSILI